MLGLKDGILTKLHEDHEEVSGLMEQILKSKSSERRGELFREVKTKLLAHAKAEQKVLYKPLEKKGDEDARKFAFEGDVEHGLVEQLLDELTRSRAKDSEPWTAKFTVLKEMVGHHVEEEESEGFKAARNTFESEELEAMGEKFEREKEKLA
jgi:hemerythrin-like domain-containing protein